MKNIKIKIERFNIEYEPKNITLEYEVPANITLLKALEYIKTKIDNTLTYSSSCRSEICGSCSMRVNNREVLACRYKIQDMMKKRLLRNSKIIKDLVVDSKNNFKKIKIAHAFMEEYQNINITDKEQKSYLLQSNCILCNSCYSSCPVFDVNNEFLGPFALSRVIRYVNDKREGDKKSKIDAIQNSGIRDCTLCGECTLVCPQGIDPKMDIMLLRGKSGEFGYTNPQFNTFNSSNEFSFGGFNPNF